MKHIYHRGRMVELVHRHYCGVLAGFLINVKLQDVVASELQNLVINAEKFKSRNTCRLI